MAVVSHFKDSTTKQASRMLVELLDRISEERLIQMLELAKKLSEGDRVILVGALSERRGRGKQEMEIRVRNLIPLTKEKPQEETPETEEKEDEIELDEEIEE